MQPGVPPIDPLVFKRDIGYTIKFTRTLQPQQASKALPQWEARGVGTSRHHAGILVLDL